MRRPSMLHYLLVFERENDLSLLKLARFLDTDVGGVLWLAQASCPDADAPNFETVIQSLAARSDADIQRLAEVVRSAFPTKTLPMAA
jgi:hypothetical protein